MTYRSAHPLGFLIRLLPGKHALFVQGEHRKVSSNLDPSAINAQGLKQHKQDDQNAEHNALQSGLFSNRSRQVVFGDCDHLGQNNNEDRAKNCTMQRAHPTDDQHHQKFDRDKQGELLGADELDLVNVKRAGETGQRSRNGKAHCFVTRQVYAHALRRNFGVTNRDERAPGRRAQQVHAQPGNYDNQQKTKKIELDFAVEFSEHQLG